MRDPRLVKAVAKAEKINLYKIASVSVFIAIVVALVILSFIRSDNTKIVFKSVIDKSQEIKAAVINPILHGTDNKNQQYSIMAKKATEVSHDNVVLEDLNAELFANNGKWFSALAPVGEMDTNDSTLILKGIVQIFTGSSEELKTEKLSLNLKRGTIVSNSPVTLISNKANLTAKKMEVTSAGKKVTFDGKVRMKIYQ
ncbi:MAG: LPS export ABC transporter periplasmic protein LptC [Alphaproteobacteria bacterium 33-17]|nr:MAG: LPS export ABC transporter periplasmic protein LptC [Alphaproteobacteria bacterium 33-17]